MDKISKSLLEKLARVNLPKLDGISAPKFRAQHPEHFDRLNKLEWDRYLEKSGEKYRLSLIGLSEILNSVNEIQFLPQRFEILFRVLKQHYEEHLNDNVSLNDLSNESGLAREDLNVALTFMIAAPIFSTWTLDFRSEDATVAPSENILSYKSFGEVLKKIRASHSRNLQKAIPIEAALNGSNNNIEDIQFLLHPTIIEHALPLYNNGHFRDAVFDSIVAVFDLIRKRTGLKGDGDALAGKAFSLHDPYLVLDELATPSGKDDQKGFIQILAGAYQGIRNPKAHTLTHDLTQLKAAQYLVFASLLARRVDEAKVIRKEQAQKKSRLAVQ